MYENGQLVILRIEDVLPNRFQPRIRFDEQKLAELAESIRKYGVIQPIVVRQIGSKFEIIAGERRFKASKLANRASIPAIIVNLSDKDSEEIALLENIQRQELTAIEEAVSYKRILDMGYITQEALAKKLGKSQSTIANKIRLLNLDDHVQDALLHGKISERHARSLLKLSNSDSQIHMLNRIITERLTVKRTDDEISKVLASNAGGTQKTIPVTKPQLTTDNSQVESLFVEPKPRKTVAVASHEIIRVTPPPELDVKKPTEELNQSKQERGQGFMDIDKIMKEAQDINVQPQVNDISDLMKKDETTVMPEPQVQVEPVENNVEQNKFVNFNGIVKEEAPVQQPNNSVSFDSIFNQQPVGVSQTQAPVHQVSQPDTQPFYANATQDEPVAPQPAVAPSPVIPEPQVAPTPIPAVPEPQIQPTPMPASPDPQVIPEPINVEPEVMSGVPEINQQPYQAPAPQPVINNVPNSDIIESQQTVPATPNVQPSMVSSTPAMAVNTNQSNNFRQVINLIRNCATQIEDLGYYIDVDEMDLEGSYQVTFKIDKE